MNKVGEFNREYQNVPVRDVAPRLFAAIAYRRDKQWVYPHVTVIAANSSENAARIAADLVPLPLVLLRVEKTTWTLQDLNALLPAKMLPWDFEAWLKTSRGYWWYI